MKTPFPIWEHAVLIDETGLLPVELYFDRCTTTVHEYAIHFQRFFKIIVILFSLIFAALEKLCKIFWVTVVLTSGSLEKNKNYVWGLMIITVTVKGDKYSNCYQNKALLCLSA